MKQPDTLYAYVDGTFNDDKIGYGVVFVKNFEILEELNGLADIRFKDQYQVAGELKAAMVALVKSKNYEDSKLVIAYDFEGVKGWVYDWKTNNELTKSYSDFMKDYIIKRKLNNKEFDLEFLKVTSSHQKNKFNELADQLALQATINYF